MNEKYYTVEGGIPVPDKDVAIRIRAREFLHSLEIGESILVPLAEAESVWLLVAELSGMYNLNFLRETYSDGCRIWRIR